MSQESQLIKDCIVVYINVAIPVASEFWSLFSLWIYVNNILLCFVVPIKRQTLHLPSQHSCEIMTLLCLNPFLFFSWEAFHFADRVTIKGQSVKPSLYRREFLVKHSEEMFSWHKGKTLSLVIYCTRLVSKYGICTIQKERMSLKDFYSLTCYLSINQNLHLRSSKFSLVVFISNIWVNICIVASHTLFGKHNNVSRGCTLFLTVLLCLLSPL